MAARLYLDDAHEAVGVVEDFSLGGCRVRLDRSLVKVGTTLYLDLPVWNLYTILRGGRYLAGDWGGTIEVGRRFDSGIEVGGFATFTNVSYSRFGEGSFDKGIYVRVPFDFFGLTTRNRAASIFP